MKRFLILPVLLLASCAPQIAAVKQAVVIATLDKGDVLIPAGAVDLTGDPTRPGDGVGLVLQGVPDYHPDAAGLTVCTQVPKIPGRFACNLGTIPANRSFRVATGAGSVIDLQGFGYRPGSAVLVPIVFGK